VVEQPAVNRLVTSSSLVGGALFQYSNLETLFL